MRKIINVLLFAMILIGILANASKAQWTSNTSLNTVICNESGDQATPKIVSTSDGGCYIMWFDNRVPNYRVYLQKMDADGIPKFGTNGMLISSNPQNSSLQDFNLDVDANNNAVIVFTDIRNGVLNPFAYLVSPSGVLLWGANGISLTDSTSISQNVPVVSATSDGSYIFAWAYSTTPIRIAMQKLNKAGMPQWTSPLKIGTGTTENFSNPRLIKSNTGSVIMSWQSYTGNLATTNTVKIFIQKFSSSGSKLWAAPQDSVQNLGRCAGISFIPYLVSDGQNGAVVCWVDDRDINSIQSVWTQRYNSSGIMQFPKNGSEGSTLSTNNHFTPSVTYLQSTSETVMFWHETNGGQTLTGGLYGQKFNTTGTRQWGSNGKELKALDNNQLSFISAYSKDTNIVVTYTESIFATANATVKAMRTGPSGTYHWQGNIITTSSSPGAKTRKQAILDKNSGNSVMTWSNGDIMGQNIGFDGFPGAKGIKFYEHFSDEIFPQEGWSTVNLVTGSGNWDITAYNMRTLPSAAISGSSILGTNNYLVTERFTPSNGDSLVFYFRQSSPIVYNDSLDIRISTTDSLVPSFTQRLLLLKDGLNYPTAGTYGKFGIDLSSYSGQNCWIAFNHVSSGLDTIMLDDVRVGMPPVNHVGVDLITEPIDTASDEETIAPSAIIINEGFNNITTSFPITFEITGPVHYTSTKYDTLSFGSSKEIFFDSVYNQIDTGDYNMTVYTSFESDYDGNGGGIVLRKNPKKKQLKKLLKKFRLRKGNRGLSVSPACATYFTTSIIQNTDIKPTFNWKTTNTIYEKILIKNGQDVSGGLYHSIDGLDNGYFDVKNALPAGKEIRICNEGRTNVFISTNGVIGVENSAPGGISGSAHKTPQWDTLLGTVYLPLWMDLDFSLIPGYSENMLSYRVINYTDGNSVLVISYYRVRVTEPTPIANKFVSFQVCIELLPAGVQDNSNYRYSYFVTDQNDPVKRTGIEFLKDYENFKFGKLNDHIVGVTHSGGFALYYRYRIKPPTKNIRRKKTGLILSTDEDNFAVEFSKYENDCKVCDGRGEDTIGIPCGPSSFKVLKEGFYSGGQYTVRDTFMVYIRNSTAPYAIVDSVKAFSDSLGNLVCRFCGASSSGSYFIVIKSRNSIETWSASPIAFVNSIANYDFTTASAKAYGDNMVQVGHKWCIYSGDVDQNGSIESIDLSQADNDAFNFTFGYVNTDVNGDSSVDAIDIAIVDNNAFNFVAKITPP